jgi:hypothetical protein
MGLGALLFAWTAPAAAPGIRVQVVGGTLPELPAKSLVRLSLADADTLFVRCAKAAELRIPYRKITTLEYGQSVSRRYAEAILISPILLLSKSHKHFVTLGFEDANGKQQALVLRVEKGDIRPLLASLEARSGRRVEFQDEEARKAIKG